MILLRIVNGILGFFAGIVLYPAKSIFANLLFLAGVAVVASLAVIPVWLLLTWLIYDFVAGDRRESYGLGIFAAILGFLAIPVLAGLVGAFVLPIAAIVYLAIMTVNAFLSFVAGALEGMFYGLGPVLLSAIVDFSKFSTFFNTLFGKEPQNNQRPPSRFQQRGSSYPLGQPVDLDEFMRARYQQEQAQQYRVEDVTGSYTGSMNPLHQSASNTAMAGLLSQAEFATAQNTLNNNQDFKDYVDLATRLQQLDVAIATRGTSSDEPLANVVCEITGKQITEPGLLLKSYRDDNSHSISMPSATKIIDKQSIECAKSTLPTVVTIEGEQKQAYYEIKDYNGLNNTKELKDIAEVVRKKLPYMDQLMEVFTGNGPFGKLFQHPSVEQQATTSSSQLPSFGGSNSQ